MSALWNNPSDYAKYNTPEVVPTPTTVKPLGYKRGDILEKTINGVVKSVDTHTQELNVLWDKVIRKEMISGLTVVDATIEQGSDDTPKVEQNVVEELKLAHAQREAALQQQLKDAIEKAGIHTVQLKDPAGKVVKTTTDMFHACFKDVCDLINDREEVFLWGPTGCGKSHLARQAAEACGLRFAFISCTAGMSEGQITGRLLPVGKNGTFEYVKSEFVDCYENGGVFLLDEVDAADPNVMLVINAALANGHMALPNRPAKPSAIRHKDFVCVGAANTVGTGADRMYSGRNKLDAAFMERFACKIYMNYDERVDAVLCPDESLRNHLLKYRKAIMAHKLERCLSTRWMGKAYNRYKAGWSIEKIDNMFFQGWREDEKNKVKGY